LSSTMPPKPRNRACRVTRTYPAACTHPSCAGSATRYLNATAYSLHYRIHCLDDYHVQRAIDDAPSWLDDGNSKVARKGSDDLDPKTSWLEDGMPSWLDYDDEVESQGESGGPTEGGRAFTGSAAAPSRLGDGDRKAARSGSDDLDKKPSWLENELPSWLEDDHRGRPTDERCIYKKAMELVDLLNTRGVPLSCYEDIRKWCTKHFTLGVLDENN